MLTARGLFNQLVSYAGRGLTALEADGRTTTYAALLEQATGLARELRNGGVKAGARLVLRLPNGPEFVTAYLACLFGGFTAVPVNRELPDADQAYIETVVRPARVLDDPRQISRCSPCKHAFEREGGLFAIFFTSGTTSRPKGVCHTADAMADNADAFNRLLGFDPSIRMLHIMPMGYMAGFLNTVLCPLAAGGTVVLAPRFSAESAMRFWKPAVDGRTNAVWMTPTAAALLARMNRGAEVPEWTNRNLRFALCGTAPLPCQVKQDFEKVFGVECLESYGMSEVQLVSCSLPGRSLPGSAGTLLEGVDVVNRRSGEGLDGHLFIRSRHALVGYLSPNTGEPMSPLEEGLLDTGDFGHVDGENRLFITGRVKDLIIHGGVNVSPRAVEDVLCSFPGVKEAAVVGQRHPFWGEEAVAFVIASERPDGFEKALLEHCRNNLGSDAVPAAIFPVEELPRSSVGKVQKHELRKRCHDPRP